MNLIKTVKKVMAVGTGAAMVGATLGTGVLAQDLSNYPSPFIQNGQFNGLIVVGDTANVADVLGSIDIATSLQYAARVERSLSLGTTARTTFSASGEAWRVADSSGESLMISELGNTDPDSGAVVRTEAIEDLQSSISKDELPSLLRDGSIRLAGSSYKYEQFLEFPKTNEDMSGTVLLKEDDDDVIAPTLFFKDDDTIAKYVLEFSDDLEVEVTDSYGDPADGGSGILWDLEGEEIEILGTTWSILNARVDGKNKVELTLMGGSESDILDEDGSKQHLIEGQTYEVSVGPITQGRGNAYTTNFMVNGERTPSMEAGDTYTLSDGSVIGVREINVQNFFGGVRRVQYYLGANKIILKDNNIEDEDGSRLEIQDDPVDNVEVNIVGDREDDDISIEKIEISLMADDDLFIQAGEKLSEHLEDDSGLLGTWDILFSGLEEVSTESIKIYPEDDNQYMLSFVDGSDNKVEVPLAYQDGQDLRLGGEDIDADTLHLNGQGPIIDGNYFIVSPRQEKSFAFQYKGADKPDTDGQGLLYFDNLGGGEEEVKYEYTSNAESIASLKVSGKTYDIYVSDGDPRATGEGGSPEKDFDIRMDIIGSGDRDGGGDGAYDGQNDGSVKVYTPAGATIMFDTTSIGSGELLVSVSSDNDEDASSEAPTPATFKIRVDRDSANDLGIAPSIVAGDAMLTYPLDSDADKKYTYTSLGTRVEIDTDSDPDSVEIMYPENQRSPAVFITSSTATISSSAESSEGDVNYYETMAINVGAGVLASEVPDVAAQNVIAVGGPCVNSVAAELLGSTSENCFEGFEQGKAMIKLMEHPNGNVGMIVAGYAAEDTRKASKVVAQYAYWQDRGEFSGTSLEVTQTNFNNVAVSSN